MFRLSPNLYLLFSEAGDDPVDRVYAAAEAGFDAVDLWGCDTDRAALRRAFDQTAITPLVLTVWPGGNITDPVTHDEFLEGVRATLNTAMQLGCPHLVATSGMALPGVPAAEQHAAVVEALTRGADIVAGSGISILLENLNGRIDHPGVYLDTTAETLQIVREIDRPEIRMLYDAYHSLVMGEDISTELTGATHLIGHVQIADTPGRHEPGTGNVNWHDTLQSLRTAGWEGPLGLEYWPVGGTDQSFTHIREVLVTNC